jgi:hypothetical protein
MGEMFSIPERNSINVPLCNEMIVTTVIDNNRPLKVPLDRNVQICNVSKSEINHGFDVLLTEEGMDRLQTAQQVT